MSASVFNFALCIYVISTCTVHAVMIEMVTVGNPGNAPAPVAGSPGQVNYVFQIGKYEITAGQYTAFLNAVASTDTYGLYNSSMTATAGCHIERDGTPGAYSYNVAADWANRPVNFVSWGDAARFANWMSNGQPHGNQDLNTTEDGSYYLNGATTDASLQSVTRKTGASYVIPDVNEWYKSAFYDPDKPNGAGYWRYPTRSDDFISNELSTTGTHNANFWDGLSDNPESYTLGPPYYLTEVGTFAGSPGPWGTFDQGGNVAEWNETTLIGPSYGNRLALGGSWHDMALYMESISPLLLTAESNNLGFRMALVPEPSSLALLVLGGLLLTRRRSSQ